ncbi:MAG: SAF domain-containing protein [Clostridium sp.]
MKNKTIGILGLLLIAFSVATWFTFNSSIKKNSQIFGEEVLVLSKDIPAGELFTNDNVVVKKIKQNDLISNYIKKSEIGELKNRVAAIPMSKNEQINKSRITTPSKFTPETAKYLSLAIDPLNSVSGEIHTGDFIDIWDKGDAKTEPVQILVNVEVIGLRDSANQNTEGILGAIPTQLIIKVADDTQVAKAKGIRSLVTCKSPNQVKTKLDAGTQ